MRLEDYPEGIRYAWCAHQTFRRLGFSAEDIWLIIARAADDGNEIHAFIALKAQGKQLNVDCGRADEVKFPELWTQFCKAFNENKFREKALQRIFDASNFNKNAVQFTVLLIDRGFRIPVSAKRAN